MSGVIVDIILLIILVGNATYGYKRGLTKMILGLLSNIIAIVLVFLLYTPISNFIITQTNFSTTLETIIGQNLQNFFENQGVTESNTSALYTDEMHQILRVLAGTEVDNILQNTVSSIIQYISTELAHKIITILVFFILFFGIRMILYIIRNYVDIISRLPVIRTFNELGGMAYGIVKGFVLIYIILAIISLLIPVLGNNIIVTSIENAKLASRMFNNNIILNIIF